MYFSLLSIFDVESMLRYGGLLLVFLLVYGTTGLFFCFFIPIGPLLFSVGIYAATGKLSYDLFSICALLILASFLGNLTGYLVGRRAGTFLYHRKDTRFFKKRHLLAAGSFYKKYGALALTIGLFIPIIRTFVSVVAGIVRLNFQRYLLLALAGSVLWISGFVLAGYVIGNHPVLRPYANYIVIGFILLFTVPLMVWVLKELKKMGKERQ